MKVVSFLLAYTASLVLCSLLLLATPIIAVNGSNNTAGEETNSIYHKNHQWWPLDDTYRNSAYASVYDTVYVQGELHIITVNTQNQVVLLAPPYQEPVWTTPPLRGMVPLNLACSTDSSNYEIICSLFHVQPRSWLLPLFFWRSYMTIIKVPKGQTVPEMHTTRIHAHQYSPLSALLQLGDTTVAFAAQEADSDGTWASLVCLDDEANISFQDTETRFIVNALVQHPSGTKVSMISRPGFLNQIMTWSVDDDDDDDDGRCIGASTSYGTPYPFDYGVGFGLSFLGHGITDNESTTFLYTNEGNVFVDDPMTPGIDFATRVPNDGFPCTMSSLLQPVDGDSYVKVAMCVSNIRHPHNKNDELVIVVRNLAPTAKGVPSLTKLQTIATPLYMILKSWVYGNTIYILGMNQDSREFGIYQYTLTSLSSLLEEGDNFGHDALAEEQRKLDGSTVEEDEVKSA